MSLLLDSATILKSTFWLFTRQICLFINSVAFLNFQFVERWRSYELQTLWRRTYKQQILSKWNVWGNNCKLVGVGNQLGSLPDFSNVPDIISSKISWFIKVILALNIVLRGEVTRRPARVEWENALYWGGKKVSSRLFAGSAVRFGLS